MSDIHRRGRWEQVTIHAVRNAVGVVHWLFQGAETKPWSTLASDVKAPRIIENMEGPTTQPCSTPLFIVIDQDCCHSCTYLRIRSFHSSFGTLRLQANVLRISEHVAADTGTLT